MKNMVTLKTVSFQLILQILKNAHIHRIYDDHYTAQIQP